jgi:hypothetical protein
MKIIKNSKELAELVDKNKDLHLEEEDVRIEYQVEEGELRNIYCRDLFLMNDNERFDFNGWDFNGNDFNGRNFIGNNFNGKKVSYYAFFNCYSSIKCESIEGRREPHAEPVCLDGKIEIISEEPITLSMDEIAEKFNIPVDKLKIKKD